MTWNHLRQIHNREGESKDFDTLFVSLKQPLLYHSCIGIDADRRIASMEHFGVYIHLFRDGISSSRLGFYTMSALSTLSSFRFRHILVAILGNLLQWLDRSRGGRMMREICGFWHRGFNRISYIDRCVGKYIHNSDLVLTYDTWLIEVQNVHWQELNCNRYCSKVVYAITLQQ